MENRVPSYHSLPSQNTLDDARAFYYGLEDQGRVLQGPTNKRMHPGDKITLIRRTAELLYRESRPQNEGSLRESCHRNRKKGKTQGMWWKKMNKRVNK